MKNNTNLATTSTVGNNSHLSVAAAIRNYTPKMTTELWNNTADFTRAAATDSAPRHEREARLNLAIISRLVAWSHQTAAHDLNRATIFSGSNIEQYIRRGLPAGTAPYSAANTRRQLMRIAERFGTVERHRVASRPAKRPPIHQPYTAAEIAAFRAMGTNRSTPLRRHNWTVFLALGAGCALSVNEMLGVKRSDVQSCIDAVRVHLEDRTVPCSADFERDLVELSSASFGYDYLYVIDSVDSGRDHRQVREHLRAAAGIEEVPNAGRLRATWIVAQLNKGVSVLTLTRALGVESLRPLEMYLPYMTPEDDAVAVAALRREVAA